MFGELIYVKNTKELNFLLIIVESDSAIEHQLGC